MTDLGYIWPLETVSKAVSYSQHYVVPESITRVQPEAVEAIRKACDEKPRRELLEAMKTLGVEAHADDVLCIESQEGVLWRPEPDTAPNRAYLGEKRVLAWRPQADIHLHTGPSDGVVIPLAVFKQICGDTTEPYMPGEIASALGSPSDPVIAYRLAGWAERDRFWVYEPDHVHHGDQTYAYRPEEWS